MSAAVALTSDTPNRSTVRLFQLIKSSGKRPLIITRDRNRDEISKLFPGPLDEIAICVHELDDPTQAEKELQAVLHQCQIQLVNWINIPDTMTVVFLHCVERLGLKFAFLDAYTNCRLKPLARQLAHESRADNVPFVVHDLESDSLPISLPLPLICKPIAGSGSEGVELIRNSRDWRRIREKRLRDTPVSELRIRGFTPFRQVLLEKKLTGEELEIDGYVSGGNLTVCAFGYKVHRYSKETGFREDGGFTYRPFSLPSECDRDEQLLGWTKRLLEAVRLSDGTFHIEAMRSGNEIHLIEINPRPGGGGVQPIIKQLTGIDLMEQCVRLWLGLSPTGVPVHTDVHSIFYLISYAKWAGKVTQVKPEEECYVPLSCIGRDEALGMWKPFVKADDKVEPVRREQYLGEIHVPNIVVDSMQLRNLIKQVSSWRDDQGFVKIAQC
jgi:biotin carboxylase